MPISSRPTSLPTPSIDATRVIRELDPTTTAFSRKMQKDALVTPSQTNAQKQRGRNIIWQTPNAVQYGAPTTLATVTSLSTPPRAGSEILAPSTSTANPLASAGALATTTTSVGKPFLEVPELALPDWPPIATFFLFTWLLGAWAVAIVLYCASVPERVRWLDRLLSRGRRMKRRWNGASRHMGLGVDDGIEDGLDVVHGDSTKTLRADRSDDHDSAIATGLGISFGGGMEAMPRLRRPRSVDESLEPPGFKTRSTDASLTAPLPSSRSFVAMSPSPLPEASREGGAAKHGRHTDVEAGLRGRSSCEYDGVADPSEKVEGTRSIEGRFEAVLESVHAAVAFVADRLARAASDEVDGGAENGLLLRVREEEREATSNAC